MKFLATLDLGGFGGGYAVTVKPSPGLRERFEAEALEAARTEHARQAEHERLASMSQEERRDYIAEQRAKVAEIKRLRELTPEQRREFIERAREENAPILYRTHNGREPAVRRDEPGDVILFTAPVLTPPVREMRPVAHDGAAHDGRSRGNRDETVDIAEVATNTENPDRSNDPARPRNATEMRDDDPADDGWNKWLRHNLLYERQRVFEAVGGGIAEVLFERDCRIRALEDKIVRLEGQLELISKMGCRRR